MDFTKPYDFASLKKTISESSSNGYGTELGSLLRHKARKEAAIDNSVKTIETISREKRRQEFSERSRLINRL